MHAVQKEKKPEKKKCSYDDDDVDNYYEEKEHIYNGSESNPEYTKQHVISKTRERSIKKDLKALGFPPEIQEKGDEIFGQMQSGLKRGVRHRQLVYFCARSAYEELGKTIDPYQLASQCQITNAEISKANSMCSYGRTGYKAPSEFKTPRHFISEQFYKISDLNILNFGDDALDKINEICDEVVAKSVDLQEEKPQTVAAAVIVFYMERHGFLLDKKKYVEIFSRSDMSISKIKTKVAVIYDS